MSDSVAETLSLWRRSAFEWGTLDCVLATCDHVLRVTGIDPAAPWRGSYSDEAGARAIYEEHGGVLALFRHGMARAGFEVGQRERGFPVVCDVMGHEIAGVDTGGKVMFLAEERGVICMRAPVLEAWVL
ncbi:hypothetical protein JI664_12575 [Rhodobacter sp. NTK016B]|uniref:DUF6950 family protein n=1 Tax=Rhodobacter sp. NTK016B TaxID=2759676 RepID=UPI001A8EAA72|nr:hypothetical protein [Rhodobacter sp. NTK016B]MBN8292801.1 hypothetical protein [Rhodobacter sp. NTK016B]